MGCVVNGPARAGTPTSDQPSGHRRSPAAPVFIDGRKTVTLRGDNIAEEFRGIVDEYVETTYARRDTAGGDEKDSPRGLGLIRLAGTRGRACDALRPGRTGGRRTVFRPARWGDGPRRAIAYGGGRRGRSRNGWSWATGVRRAQLSIPGTVSKCPRASSSARIAEYELDLRVQRIDLCTQRIEPRAQCIELGAQCIELGVQCREVGAESSDFGGQVGLRHETFGQLAHLVAERAGHAFGLATLEARALQSICESQVSNTVPTDGVTRDAVYRSTFPVPWQWSAGLRAPVSNGVRPGPSPCSPCAADALATACRRCRRTRVHGREPVNPGR